MTISKERLNEIALEVAQFSKATDKEITDFALALIRRVEAESNDDSVNLGGIKAIALPLVWRE